MRRTVAQMVAEAKSLGYENVVHLTVETNMRDVT